MKLAQKFAALPPFILRHLVTQHAQPYEQILRYVSLRKDIWTVSQGEYMSWWARREKAGLSISVSGGVCRVSTSLENAVIEKFPGEFLDSGSLPCPETKFSGELWLTIDSRLEHQEVLIELLKREGIFNYRLADRGEIMITQADVGALLAEIAQRMQKRLAEDDVRAIRQVVIDKLAAHNLPLLRVWYHPRVAGVIMRAVFSPRFDVDRAITNLPRIRALETKYNISSTLYIRAFCPFYTDQAIKKLAAAPWCSEIALHGEFITHARQNGDEFKAAQAEKSCLETLAGRPVLGVAMHGGELSYNRSDNTDDAIQQAGFLYDTTPALRRYYFPFKRIVKGQISQAYSLPCALSDISLSSLRSEKVVVNGNIQQAYNSSTGVLDKLKQVSAQDQNQLLYEKAVTKMDEVYEQNGVFVFTLHPAYFGFLAYLARPDNWLPLAKFALSYFKRSK